MSSRTPRDDRRTAPRPPEVTTDAVRDLFERALAAESKPEARPEPPEITADDVRRLFEDAGWFDSSETTSLEQTVSDVDPEPTSLPPDATLRTVQCPSCYGTGTQLCTSCYGSGYQTTSYTTTDWEGNVEYVTDQYPCGCSAGTVACGVCGGRGAVSR